MHGGVSRQVHGLFQRHFSTDCDLVTLSINFRYPSFSFKYLQRKQVALVPIFGNALSGKRDIVVLLFLHLLSKSDYSSRSLLCDRACCYTIMNQLGHHLLCASGRY